MTTETWRVVAIIIYTVIVALPLLYWFDKIWTSEYSRSKDVRIIMQNDHFHLERQMFLFRRWIKVKDVPVTTQADKVMDAYNKIQKGEWGKKIIKEPV